MDNPPAPSYAHRDLPLLLAIAIVSFGVGALLIFFAFTDRGSPGHLPPFSGLSAELAFFEWEPGPGPLPDPNREPHSHAEEFRFHRGSEHILAILTLRFEATDTQLGPDYSFYLYPPWPSDAYEYRTSETYEPGTTGATVNYPLGLPDGWHTGLWKVEVFAEDVWIAGGIFYTD